MSTIEIAKDAFPWEACATVAASLFALVAAIHFGSKQTAIAERQVDIIQRQTKLQELALQDALFDRRFKIYRQTQSILRSLFRSAAPPSTDEVSEFWAATDQAQFLFRPEVHQELVRILQAINTLVLCETHLHGDDKVPVGPTRTEYEKMKETEMVYIVSLGDTLNNTFSADLSIQTSFTAP